MNLDLDNLVGILKGSDAATEAAYNALPPTLQWYVDTGDASVIQAHYAERGIDAETFDAWNGYRRFRNKYGNGDSKPETFGIPGMNLDAYHALHREAAALGLSVSTVRERKHFVLRVSDNAGHSGLLVVSRSGSDRRGRYQARAQLRRLARQLGEAV